MKNIVVFASGTGTNFINIYKNLELGNIELLISNNANCGAVQFAKLKDINFKIINNSTSNNIEQDYKNVLKIYNPDLILLAGFLKKIPKKIINLYKNKIMNVHPSLLPKYGGKGFFGINVHRSVIESKDKITGATIHFVDEKYDEGPIILQKQLEVLKNDSAESLSKKVLQIEYDLYLKAVTLFCNDKIKILNKKVIIDD
tara:strand:+ start:1061 stop:1660 length:600 start_codon:yes stop_codon:yes gene_type:complete